MKNITLALIALSIALTSLVHAAVKNVVLVHGPDRKGGHSG